MLGPPNDRTFGSNVPETWEGRGPPMTIAAAALGLVIGLVIGGLGGGGGVLTVPALVYVLGLSARRHHRQRPHRRPVRGGRCPRPAAVPRDGLAHRIRFGVVGIPPLTRDPAEPPGRTVTPDVGVRRDHLVAAVAMGLNGTTAATRPSGRRRPRRPSVAARTGSALPDAGRRTRSRCRGRDLRRLRRVPGSSPDSWGRWRLPRRAGAGRSCCECRSHCHRHLARDHRVERDLVIGAGSGTCTSTTSWSSRSPSPRSSARCSASGSPTRSPALALTRAFAMMLVSSGASSRREACCAALLRLDVPAASGVALTRALDMSVD